MERLMTNTLPRVTHEVKHTHYDEHGVERHMRVWLTADGTHHVTMTTTSPTAPAPSVTEFHLSGLGFGLLAGLMHYACAHLGQPASEVVDVPA
jgi:hypothetical protein